MGKLYGTKKHGVMAPGEEAQSKASADATFPKKYSITLDATQATAKKVTFEGLTSCSYPLAAASDGTVRAVSKVKSVEGGIEVTLGAAATGDVVTVFGI